MHRPTLLLTISYYSEVVQCTANCLARFEEDLKNLDRLWKMHFSNNRRTENKKEEAESTLVGSITFACGHLFFWWMDCKSAASSYHTRQQGEVGKKELVDKYGKECSMWSGIINAADWPDLSHDLSRTGAQEVVSALSYSGSIIIAGFFNQYQRR